MKLPRWIAIKISRIIAEEALHSGDSLGSEGELIAKFGVGRSVLREAIRMLELHNVVTMRSGQGGGLRVATPDPGPTFRSVIPFLRDIPSSSGHAFEISAALEIDAVGLASDRSDQARTELLEQARATVTAALADETSGAEAKRAASQAIASAGGDKVLELIVRVAQEVHTEGIATAALTPQLIRLSEILEAAIATDRPRARRLMRSHLRSLSAERTANAA